MQSHYDNRKWSEKWNGCGCGRRQSSNPFVSGVYSNRWDKLYPWDGE